MRKRDHGIAGAVPWVALPASEKFLQQCGFADVEAVFSRLAELRAFRIPAIARLCAVDAVPVQQMRQKDGHLLRRFHGIARMQEPAHIASQGIRRTGRPRQDQYWLVLRLQAAPGVQSPQRNRGSETDEGQHLGHYARTGTRQGINRKALRRQGLSRQTTGGGATQTRAGHLHPGTQKYEVAAHAPSRQTAT